MLHRIATGFHEFDDKLQSYHWTDWALIALYFSLLLLLTCIYIFVLDPQDPNGIYKSPELQLNPSNEEIRVLILEPGEWSQPIRCRLEKIGLGAVPIFTALSYAWVENFPLPLQRERKTIFDYAEYGYCQLANWLDHHRHKETLKRMRTVLGDRRKQIIWVNNKKHEVGLNLELALRHIRVDRGSLGREKQSGDQEGTAKEGNGELALWADAVCINQDDVNDRNKQVSSMREVYKMAERVEIWLGTERDFRQEENEHRVLDKSRERSVIGDINPRGGHDLVYEMPAGAEDTPSSPFDENNNVHEDLVPLLPTETENRVEKTIDSWEEFHNSPKLLREEQPDYTQEFFSMIYLFQKKAFQECNKRNPPPLDERVIFLKQASSRAHVLEVFKEIMDRLWWNRLWVVQETVIAKHVDIRYGRFVIPWESFVIAAKNFRKHRHRYCCVEGFESLPSGDVDVLAKFADIVLGLDTWRKGWTIDAKKEGRQPDIRLLRLLWQFRDRQTSEPRDKVFALLPLVTSWGTGEKHKTVIPKYDWTVPDVYVNVVRTLLSVEDSINVLAGNARKTKKLADLLPSWAPDWSEPPEPGEIARLERMNLYKAAGSETMESRILGTNEFLELKGIEHSSVLEIAEVMVPDLDAASYAKSQRTFKAWERLAELEDLAKKEAQYQNFGYSRETAYYKTMCMNSMYKADKHQDSSQAEVNKITFELAPANFGEGLRKWNTYADNHGSPLTCGPNIGARRMSRPPIFKSRGRHEEPKLKQFVSEIIAQKAEGQHDMVLRRQDTPQNHLATQINETVESATVSRRFFITDTGHMGLAPRDTQVGDHVFVLFGGKVPFILRDAGRRNIPRGSAVLDGRDRIPKNRRPQPDELVDTEGRSTASTTDRPQTPPSRQPYFRLRTPQKKHSNSDDRATKCYRLIGDCYVQGLMEGEALALKEDKAGWVYLV
jgi:hypothetical protein